MLNHHPKIHLLLSLFCTLAALLPAKAQNTYSDLTVSLRGHVYGKDEGTQGMPLPGVSIRCVALPDSTYIFSATTDRNGFYQEAGFLEGNATGILLTFSYIGMKPHEQLVKAPIGRNDLGLPTLKADMDTTWMEPQPITMREAVIVEQLKKMYMSGDTTLFRTDAYEMPKGSMLLDLVRRLPGLECSEDGKLTYLGKPIDELRLNGKEFFKHDATIALRNMPVEHLKYLKIYEELERDSPSAGPEDKRTVMDMETKDPVSTFLAGNLKGGKTAEEDDYMGQGDLNWHKVEKGEASVKAEINTLPSSLNTLGKFSTGNTYVTGSRQEKSVGALFSHFGNKANVRGIIDYEYGKTGDRRLISDETYLQDNSQIEQDELSSINRNQATQGSFDIDGHGKQISWNVNAQLGHTRTQDETRGQGDTYAAPFGTDGEGAEPVRELLNSRRNDSQTELTRKTARLTGHMGYRFGKDKSLDLNFRLDYTGTDKMNRDYTDVTFHRTGTHDTYDRISHNLSHQTMLDIGLSYAQSVGERGSLSLRYQYVYNRNRDDKDYFDLAAGDPSDDFGHGLHVPDDAVYNAAYSYLNRSGEQCHELSFRLNARFGKWDMGVSCGFTPTLQHIDYEQEKRQNDTTRVTLVYSPQINANYRHGKHALSLNYHASNLPPGLNLLFPVANNDDPLTVREGNEHLKPSVNHGGRVAYSYDRWLDLSAGWSGTSNETGTVTTYDPETGVRHVRDVNVNGSWTANGSLRLSKYADDFDYALSASYLHDRRPGFIETAAASAPQKTVTRSHRFSLQPSAGYARKGFEARLRPSWNYDVLESQGYEGRRMQRYMVDLDVAYTFDFGLGLYSSYDFNAYKGFNATEGKDKEHIWNLGVSFNTWKNRLTLKAEGYDVLGQQSGFSCLYYPNGTGKREARNFAKASYVLFTVAYRFTTLKSRQTPSNGPAGFFSSPNVIIVR